MVSYIVSADGYDEEYYETLEEAEKAYEVLKTDLMAEGHENGTQITLYEVKPLLVATSVVDEERMKKGLPKDKGYEWDNWAKWDEKMFT